MTLFSRNTGRMSINNYLHPLLIPPIQLFPYYGLKVYKNVLYSKFKNCGKEALNKITL